MISAQARAGFERIFFDAARTRLASGGACEIRPVAVDAHDASHDPSRTKPRATQKVPEHVAVLTISALHFRLLLALRFRDDEPTRRHFAAAAAASGASAQRPLPEAFMEVANLCCGAINQALTAPFPDLGMSTPYLLSGASVDYLHALNPDHVAAYDVTLDGDVRIGATLCVCANAPIDFHVPEAASVDTGGELELF